MITISQSNGIFSKLKFISNVPTSDTNLNNSSEEDSLSITSDNSNVFSISSSTTETLVDNINSPNLFTREKCSNQNSEALSIQNTNNICFSKLNANGNNYSATGKRKILFKVEKYKFDYPVPKSTTLYYYPNLPIIQSLELTTQLKHDSSQTTTIMCNNQSITVPIEFDYDEITFKPYVSYSIALYNQKPPIIFDPSKPNSDIYNLDIYTLENDALFLTPFTLCFPVNSKNFVP